MHLQHVSQGLNVASLCGPIDFFVISDEACFPCPLRRTTITLRLPQLLVLIDERLEAFESLTSLSVIMLIMGFRRRWRLTSRQQFMILAKPSCVLSSARERMLSSVSRVSASSVTEAFKLSSSFSTSRNSAGAPALPDVKHRPIFQASEDSIMISPIDGAKAMMMVWYRNGDGWVQLSHQELCGFWSYYSYMGS